MGAVQPVKPDKVSMVVDPMIAISNLISCLSDVFQLWLYWYRMGPPGPSYKLVYKQL